MPTTMVIHPHVCGLENAYWVLRLLVSPGRPCRSYPGSGWSRSLLSAIAFDASPDQDEHSRDGGDLVGRRAPVVESCCGQLTS